MLIDTDYIGIRDLTTMYFIDDDSIPLQNFPVNLT